MKKVLGVSRKRRPVEKIEVNAFCHKFLLWFSCVPFVGSRICVVSVWGCLHGRRGRRVKSCGPLDTTTAVSRRRGG